MVEIQHNEWCTAAFWRATFSLACIMLATSLMNIVVFPLFDPVFTYARDISQTVQVIVLLGVGVVATFRPSALEKMPLLGLSVGALAGGAVLLPVSVASGSAALLIVGSSVFAAGRGAAVLAVAANLAQCLQGRDIALSVALAFVAAFACQAVCWVVPMFVGFALYLALPIIAFALALPGAREMVHRAVSGEAPADAIITRPSSYVPLSSRLFACLFLFQMAFGFSLRYGEASGVPVNVFLGIVPIAIAAILIVLWDRFDADLLTQISVLCVAVGFFSVPSSDAALRDAGNVLLNAGNTLFAMVGWIVIASVGSRNRTGALAAAGWGNGVGALGTIVGAALGVASNHLLERYPTGLLYLSGVLLVLVVGYALIGLKDFSFKAIIEGIVPVEEPDVRSESPEDLFQARCDAIAEKYHLTPREREVFAMLARGRNREYIQEKLVVSRNTVKAHVRHVYEKLDIHSHQELIDLVEEGAQG